MKRLLILLALVTSTALADEVQVKLGGTVTNTSDLYTGSLSYVRPRSESNPMSEYLDSDFFYSANSTKTTRNELNVYGKINYELDDKNYLQTATRYQHDEFATYQDKVVVGIGHGDRFYHTDLLKVSAETSIAMAEASGLNQPVFRESVWASYNFAAKANITNKFLIETGGPIDYKRNVLSVNYDFTDRVIGSVANTIELDSGSHKTTTAFSLGMKF